MQADRKEKRRPLFGMFDRLAIAAFFGTPAVTRTLASEQGRQEISDLSSPEHGTLKLAVTTAGTLPQILREFRKKRPHIQFHVQMLTTQEMVPSKGVRIGTGDRFIMAQESVHFRGSL